MSLYYSIFSRWLTARNELPKTDSELVFVLADVSSFTLSKNVQNGELRAVLTRQRYGVSGGPVGFR